MKVAKEERNCIDCMNLKVKNNVIQCKFEKNRELVRPIHNQKSEIKSFTETFFRIATTCETFEADEPFEEVA